MKEKPDIGHYIPIMDFSACGEKDMPLSFKGPFVKNDFPEIGVSICPKCDRVPLDESEIKDYASEEELQSMGWSKVEG